MTPQSTSGKHGCGRWVRWSRENAVYVTDFIDISTSVYILQNVVTIPRKYTFTRGNNCVENVMTPQSTSGKHGCGRWVRWSRENAVYVTDFIDISTSVYISQIWLPLRGYTHSQKATTALRM